MKCPKCGKDIYNTFYHEDYGDYNDPDTDWYKYCVDCDRFFYSTNSNTYSELVESETKIKQLREIWRKSERNE